MKFYSLLAAVFIFPLFSQAAVLELEYKVVSSECLMGKKSCQFPVKKIKLIKDDATDEIQMERYEASGSLETWFLKNSGSNEDDNEALSADDQLKRLIYSRSNEIFATGPDFVIQTVAISLQFYQINALEAVLLETTDLIESDGKVSRSTVTAKLKR